MSSEHTEIMYRRQLAVEEFQAAKVELKQFIAEAPAFSEGMRRAFWGGVILGIGEVQLIREDLSYLFYRIHRDNAKRRFTVIK